MIIVEKTVIVEDDDLQEGVQGPVFSRMKAETYSECLTAEIVIYHGKIVKNRCGAIDG